MVDTSAPQNQIAAALARGATVLVPSPRAAQAMRREYARHQGLGQVQPSQQQPVILSWRAWTSGMWHRALLTGAADRLLLNRSQEQSLWRELIEREPAVSSLRNPGSLARLAAEAWGSLAQHGGLARLAGSATNGDTETFARLAATFDQRCRGGGYLPEARLEWALGQAILANKLYRDEKELLLCGFDRLLPAQEQLLDALKESGSTIAMLPHPEPARDRQLLAFADEAGELRAAALWCRAFLERQPTARIAVLVPGLAEDHSAPRIDRVFRDVLAPGAAAWASLPYEIVSGSPLAETALVAGALDLLAWTIAPLTLDRVSALLLSPLLGGREPAARAEFDAFELRRSHVLRPEVKLDWLLKRLERSARRERLGQLMTGLRAMQAMAWRRLAQDVRKTWADWAEIVRELLTAAGWAGRPPADAAEYETRRAWESVLDELTTLDFEGGEASWEQAVTALRGLAGETMLASPARDAPVQVMTPADAAGMRFDAVCFLRAGDLSWPVPIGGNPLLGWPLRRELGMPGSDAGADQARARRVTERIAGSAGTVIFSYAQEALEGRQRASPVLSGLGLRAVAAETIVEETLPLVELEALPDDTRVPPPPDGPVQGGAAVLRAQAACGFRAFAEWRLFSWELDAREPGMDQRERGSSVHRVLEHFWEAVGTQSALHLMVADQREARLAESVDRALAKDLEGAKTAWEQAYLETQRRRLMTLGRRWLTIEADRPIPFTVDRRESETRDAAIGPLHLTLRVDRVDRTRHGAVLIDYKTGDATASNWLGERPDEPQLPLYAVLASERLHAIAFGKVRPGQKMEFTGYEDRQGTLNKPAKLEVESLQAQIAEWKSVLSRLATDFWNGERQVLPKQFPTTCQYCPQRLLCRLETASVLDVEEDEELAEDDEFVQGEFPG